MPRFSVHLDYLFTERPFLERIDAAAAAGFTAVECRFPEGVAAADFKNALEPVNGFLPAEGYLFPGYAQNQGFPANGFSRQSLTLSGIPQCQNYD